MTTDLVSAIAAVVASASGIGNVWFWYDKKKTDADYIKMKDNLSRMEKQQIEHANKFVTEDRSREIIRDEIRSIKEDTAETKSDVKNMMSILSNLESELRVTNAVQQVLQDLEKKR